MHRTAAAVSHCAVESATVPHPPLVLLPLLPFECDYRLSLHNIQDVATLVMATTKVIVRLLLYVPCWLVKDVQAMS